MRVALVQETLDPRRGGAETSTREMAEALAARGCDVTAVYRGKCSDQPDRIEEGVNYHPVYVATKSRLGRAIRFVRGADEYCREQRFDIVQAITPCFSANVYQPRGGTYRETVARNIAQERTPWGKALKWIDRRLNRRQRFLLLLERDLLCDPRGPHVAALSEYVRRQVEEGYGVPAERVRVVFNGVDFTPLDRATAQQREKNLRAGLSLAEKTPIVLFVAHNFKLKGLGELMRALARWPRDAERAWRRPGLVVVGSDERGPYIRLSKRLGVFDDVRFVHAEIDMRSLYGAAAVVAHPTWYDPCSRVVLEALSCGVPVVTTRWNGAAEAMQPGVHGEIIAAPSDPAALQAAIERCLTPQLRTRCRAEATTFRQRHAMRRHAEELAAYYEDVLRARERASQ